MSAEATHSVSVISGEKEIVHIINSDKILSVCFLKNDYPQTMKYSVLYLIESALRLDASLQTVLDDAFVCSSDAVWYVWFPQMWINMCLQ